MTVRRERAYDRKMVIRSTCEARRKAELLQGMVTESFHTFRRHRFQESFLATRPHTIPTDPQKKMMKYIGKYSRG